jgi:hypoxanthine phosphoribosyltransferase
MKGVDRVVGEILISEEELQRRIRELATQISLDTAGQELVVVGVLKGAIMFIVDLMRYLPPTVVLDFMAIASYGGSSQTSGVVRILKDLETDIGGRRVLVVEDIVDSGLTLAYILQMLQSRNPDDIKVCALLDKRSRRKVDVPIHYVGFQIPDKFVVGYGLDYLQLYRNLPYVGVVSAQALAAMESN